MAEQGFWNALTGHSNAQSKSFAEDPEYEKYRYQYGGTQGGDRMAINDLQARQAGVENRAAPQMQAAQLDQTAANQTRGVQMGSLAGLQAAASGEAPSAAENLAQQGIDRSLRAQTSAAGNVRGGPGATASAYRYAAQNAAQQRADMNQSVQAQRANEMAEARGQLASAAGAARGQDLTAATANAQFTQDANKTNAQNQIQETALNDQRASQYEQLQHQIAQDQLNANVQQQQLQAGVRQTADSQNTQTNQFNARQNQNLFNAGVGLVQGVVGGVGKILSDPASKIPIVGSLAGFGLGGSPMNEVDPGTGTVQLHNGSISHDDLLKAGSGRAGASSMMGGMVGGGGITGGSVNTMGRGSDGSTNPLQNMMSDERTKVKSRNEILESLLGGAANARPYDRDPEFTRGVAGAPRGYASGRAAPEEDNVSWSKPETWGMNKPGKSTPDTTGQAPGTDDYERTGGDAAKNGEVDWANGGSIAKPEGRPGVFEALFGGLANARPFGAATAPRDTTTSDPAAKRAAYAAGLADGAAKSQGGKVERPRGVGAPLGEDEELVVTAEGEPEIQRTLDARERDLGHWIDAAARAREAAKKNGGIDRDEAYFPPPAPAYSGSIDRDEAYLPPGKAAEEPPPSKKASKADAKSGSLDDAQDYFRYASQAASGFGMPLPPSPAAAALIASFGAGAVRGRHAADERARSADTDQQIRDEQAAMNAAERRATTLSDERTKGGFARPSDEQMARAMRSMDPAVYAYKPEYSPPDQAPGEVNVGPMANAMAKDPVARTAIVRDGKSGMLAIDKSKAEKVIMGSLAALQHQIDQLETAPRAKKRSRNAESHA